MKILVISPKNKTVFNFRGELVKKMAELGHEVIVTGPDMQYVEDIEKLGARFIEVPLVKDGIGIFKDLKYCFLLKKIIKSEKPDRIFSYTIKPVIYGSLAGGQCGVEEIYPMITGVGRVYGENGIKVKIARVFTSVLYKKAFRYCKKVIFQNYDDMELFVKNKYLPREKCLKIDGSGVNMQRFSLSELPEEKTFLMISRIIKEKGVLEFCKASEIVKKSCPEARFVILGGFDKSALSIKKQIDSYAERGIVEMPGEVKDVSEILSSAYCFVLPTYYREGIPRTILEAMACGKCVITTDWVGTKEAVEDGVNGYLVPIKDELALAEKMLLVATDRALCEKLGKNGFEICKERFEVGIINEKMLDFMNIK